MKNDRLNKTLAFRTGKDIARLVELKPGISSNLDFIPPSTQTESEIYTIWKAVLGHESFGVNDDFFKIGGNSLKAVQVISRICRQYPVNINLTDIFSQPTIKLLALHILKPQTSLSLSTLEITTRPGYIPLSFSQERLWFIDQLEGSVQYHLPYVLRLKGELNNDAVDYALQTLVNRHEILRTVIRNNNGEGYQLIKDKNAWQLSRIEGVNYKNTPDELKKFIVSLINKPFDLSNDYLLRVTIIKLNDQENIFVATLHHMASDGWSKSIFVKELVHLYNTFINGDKEELPPLSLQYADYAIWQRKQYHGDWFNNKLSYWKTKLENISPLALPTTYQRLPVQSTRGAKIDFKVDDELFYGLKELSHQQGVTLYMTLLSAFKVLLHRYSGQNDVCVGTPVANRTLKEMEELVGFFVNTVVLRSHVESDAVFTDFLQQVKAGSIEAYNYQDVPFEKVVEAVVKERDPSRNPIFQVMFILQNVPVLSTTSLRGIHVSRESVESSTSQFDITFNIRETHAGLIASVDYCTDLFSEEAIIRMIGHYKELLISIVKNPAQKIGLLPMLTAAEEHQLLHEFNATTVAYPKNKTIIDLFEEQVIKTPDSIAVIFEEQQLTYKELNERANQLANYLHSKDVNKETLVPICIERGTEMIVGILGILKAGGAYVPIDPQYPQSRIDYMVKDVGAKLIISTRASSAKLQPELEIIELDTAWRSISEQPVNNLKKQIAPKDLAYVIYTSGSTGQPKGVMIEHSNVYYFISWCIDEFSNSSFEIVYAGTSICFDLSVFEIFYPLSIGKRLRIIESGLYIGKYLPEDSKVLTNSVPTIIENLLKEGANLQNISVMNMAGEPIPFQVQKDLNADKMEIRNLYGPTEDTTYSTVFRLKKGEPACIGRPISNSQVYIVNNEMTLVPVGITGEICLGGAGLARGYLNRNELTKEKFINNPFNQDGTSRLYRTGDIGRWLPDGNIEYIGRLDNQVKIRGYRIELGEIENVLQQSGLVKSVIIVARKNNNDDTNLIGYVIADSFDREAAITYLKNCLPEYMIPAIWMELEAFPLTTNGKINRKALPEPEDFIVPANEFAPPQTEIEISLANTWKTLLNREEIGIHDNFFELGGHSLLAMRVVSAIRQNLGIELNIKDLFQYPTINELSIYIEYETDFEKGSDITSFEEVKI